MEDYKSLLIWGLTSVITLFIALCLGLVIGMKGALMGLILVPSLVLSFRYPYWGLLGFLVYMPFGGTVTYAIARDFQKVGSYVIYDNSSSALFHLAKDVFYFPAMMAIALKPWDWGTLWRQLRPVAIAIGLLLLSCLITFSSLQLFNSGPSILVGMIGLKVMLGYVPWILCGIYLLRDRASLLWLMRLWVILILVCCGLTLIQYGMLQTGICEGNVNLPPPANTQASLQAQCFVGGSLLFNPERGLLRLPGTFVSPWHWAWFLISSCFISYGTYLLDPAPRWRGLAILAMAAVLGATLVSGQRTALLLVPVFWLVQLSLTETQKSQLALKLGLIALLSAILVSQWEFLKDAIANFLDRWQYSPPPSFVSGQFQWLFEHNLTLFGHGLGRASSAARRLGDIQLIETFYVKILYEIGVAGFAAFLFLLGAIIVLTFRHYRSLTDLRLKSFALCLWLFIIVVSLNPYYYPLMVDPVTIYYWLVVGILFMLPALEKMPIAPPVVLPQAWRKGDYVFASQERADPKLEVG